MSQPCFPPAGARQGEDEGLTELAASDRNEVMRSVGSPPASFCSVVACTQQHRVCSGQPTLTRTLKHTLQASCHDQPAMDETQWNESLTTLIARDITHCPNQRL